MSSPPLILLLKTKSTPHDHYADLFSTRGFAPTFVPVLEHRLHEENLRRVHELFISGAFGPVDSESSTTSSKISKSSGRINGSERKYGGLIFTSQRAVSGFGKMLEHADCIFPSFLASFFLSTIYFISYTNFMLNLEIAVSLKHQTQSPPLTLYTVGPATARSLTSLRDAHLPHALIYGSDAGNGENLAYMILEHYNTLYPDKKDVKESDHDNGSVVKPALLFLVGEQRRDIIPKTLMSDSIPTPQRIEVEEIVIYESGVMHSFEEDFRTAINTNIRHKKIGDGDHVLWVVVFSPSGCEDMLRVLGLGPFSSKSESESESESDMESRKRRAFVATIGPTTCAYLREKFGFEPDVVANQPSPEGVAAAIEGFMRDYELMSV